MESTGRITKDLHKLLTWGSDTCRTCGSKLDREALALAGYGADGHPLYVGECCSSSLRECATFVRWWEHAGRRCDRETRLWRYMDFAKFLSILETRAIYFPRADTLGDPFEGAAGIVDRREQWNSFYRDFFRDAMMTAPRGDAPTPSEDELVKYTERFIDSLAEMGARDRIRSYVSCWHANDGESEALWRLYCPAPAPGIAIETTAERLMEAFDYDPNIKLGRVRYVDFQEAFANVQDRLFWKRKSLSHESEVRAVIARDQPAADIGLSIAADVEKLLVSVVPSPFAGDWLTALVEATVKRYGVTTKVARSELLLEPFF